MMRKAAIKLAIAAVVGIIPHLLVQKQKQRRVILLKLPMLKKTVMKS